MTHQGYRSSKRSSTPKLNFKPKRDSGPGRPSDPKRNFKAKKQTDSTSQRIQKALAAAGVGSRRDVERWIKEGRLLVNGAVPALGTKLAARDRITLDGRPVKVRSVTDKAHAVLLFHRSPGTPLEADAASTRLLARSNSSGAERAHSQSSRMAGRWLAVQPLPPVDGGLEILTNDGGWAHRVSRGVHVLTTDYVLRMRGALSDALVEEFRATTHHEDEPMCILTADAQFGEGLNHWLKVTARATRPALIRHWWGARGLIISRLMRVRLGPVHLTRDIPRGRSRAMLSSESAALMTEIAAAVDAAAHAPGEVMEGEREQRSDVGDAAIRVGKTAPMLKKRVLFER